MNQDFFLTILAVGFGCWAGVVAWGVNRVTQQIDQISSNVARLADQVTTEVRRLDQILNELQRRADALELQHQNFLHAVTLAIKTHE